MWTRKFEQFTEETSYAWRTEAQEDFCFLKRRESCPGVPSAFQGSLWVVTEAAGLGPSGHPAVWRPRSLAFFFSTRGRGYVGPSLPLFSLAVVTFGPDLIVLVFKLLNVRLQWQ